jgi:hypothetical protein
VPRYVDLRHLPLTVERLGVITSMRWTECSICPQGGAYLPGAANLTFTLGTLDTLPCASGDCRAHGRFDVWGPSAPGAEDWRRIFSESLWISDHVPMCGNPSVVKRGLRQFRHIDVDAEGRETMTVDVLLCWQPLAPATTGDTDSPRGSLARQEPR